MRRRKSSGSRSTVRRFPIPMRGNESTDKTYAGGSAPAFPIPMRGNEKHPAWDPNRMGLFPIPMRGNELTGPMVGLPAIRRFPIPMRGNEEEKRKEAQEEYKKFPIPMRGNEGSRFPWCASTGREWVSDPHEG